MFELTNCFYFKKIIFLIFTCESNARDIERERDTHRRTDRGCFQKFDFVFVVNLWAFPVFFAKLDKYYFFRKWVFVFQVKLFGVKIVRINFPKLLLNLFVVMVFVTLFGEKKFWNCFTVIQNKLKNSHFHPSK